MAGPDRDLAGPSRLDVARLEQAGLSTGWTVPIDVTRPDQAGPPPGWTVYIDRVLGHWRPNQTRVSVLV